MQSDGPVDLTIIGAGVLGTSIAYLLSLRFGGKIAVIEKELVAGIHTSTRNTGVIHRPFYLDPDKKKIFANAAQQSYALWEELARRYDLPWNQVGTLEIAVRETDIQVLDRYKKWAEVNGMAENEIKIYNDRELREYQPDVRGFGAILSKTDTGVNFGLFTQKLMELAQANGVIFLNDAKVSWITETGDGVDIHYTRKDTSGIIRTGFLINASGGDALKFAHILGLARKYAVLHFRGDYWVVNDAYRVPVKHNIYTVPKHQKFPFLDPHFILRHDGRREVGPTAALVGSPYDYSDSVESHSVLLKLFERPTLPKLKLALNPEFISLVRTEWRSSRYPTAMGDRVRQFIPSLADSYLQGKGLSGVRNSLIDSHGFVPEAILEESDRSMHILNFNSPGATGAPAYAAFIIRKLRKSGKIVLSESREKEGILWPQFELEVA